MTPLILLAAVGEASLMASTAGAATALTTSQVVTLFFTNLFLHPGHSFYAVIILAIPLVAIPIGLAFVIKLLYDRNNINFLAL